MKTFQFSTLTLAIASMSFVPAALAAPAGTLLFAQDGVQIINPQGAARPARQGDVLQTGERLVTPTNAISQVKLPDGSLIGMRPGSELKMELPPPGITQAQQVLSLIQGAARVIGAELMDQRKPSSLTLQTGQATLNLKGADLESAVVKPGTGERRGNAEAGSYNRLLTGTGSIHSGSSVEPLAVRQVSFVSPSDPMPKFIASVSPTLFSSARPNESRIQNPDTLPKPPTSASGTLPVLTSTTSTLTSRPLGLASSGLPPTPAINQAPVFSPVSTGIQIGTAATPRLATGAAVLASTASPLPQRSISFAPLAILRQPILRQPLTCIPSRIIGQPPICR